VRRRAPALALALAPAPRIASQLATGAARRNARSAHASSSVGAWRIVAGRTVLLDNNRRGRVGYEVLTPLKLKIRCMCWSTRLDRARADFRAAHAAGEVRIEGIALERLPHALELEKNTA